MTHSQFYGQAVWRYTSTSGRRDTGRLEMPSKALSTLATGDRCRQL